MASSPPIETRTRGHKKRERTRSQLIAAALRVFAQKGGALTVSDVVAEAEVSNGTFYNYFADRDALFDVLAGQLTSSLAAEAAVEIETDDAVLRLAMASARVLARAAADRTWGTIVLRLEILGDGVQEQATHYLREDLNEGYRQGRFEVAAEDVNVEFVAATLGVAIRRIVSGRADETYVVQMLSRMLRGLGAPRDEIAGIVGQAVRAAGLPRELESRS